MMPSPTSTRRRRPPRTATTLCVLCLSCAAIACVGGGGGADGGGGSPLGTVAGGCPPPADGIFLDRNTGNFADLTTGSFEPGDLEFPNSQSTLRLCCIPDADSFDRYAEDASGAPAPYPTGTPIPVSSECGADGRETGPRIYEQTGNLDDLFPSRWCPDPSCS